ncbi:helix-turn-helix transcriptional regulator [Plantibacter sp. VKM Ac-2885]|uniref:winged helix-turn-helix transcriptional regulator n=1 Tax=Plantibacter sp. VKM Ac-2885 TaxID=2783828 RepID=UPI00188A3696|nr:helix-turn-helix domain-containing protein [Plantibacter sp. VKM Ac-2885]MBF4514181.1 helix-turn-helix transcriptional regulator [Plantibacter sp. VKM Ac-2885]
MHTTAPAQTPAFPIDQDVDAWCDEADARPLVREILTMTSDRWSMLVIQALAHGPVRFTHLMTQVEGVSHRMLTQTVRRLQRDGLVSRTSYPESPPRVEYALTALGTSFGKPVQAMIHWTLEHQNEIEQSRERFGR